MSKHNGNGKHIHKNSLMPSTIDEVSLCKKVEDGFVTVCNLYRSQNEADISIPDSLDSDMLHWRQMAVRYRNGDMRHTEAEFKSLKVIAQWTISMNCKLRGQPDKKVIWK